MKETLVDALRFAGAELLRNFGKHTDFKEKESRSSIVTQADLKSDSLIVNLIRERFPGHNIISEESGFSDGRSKYTWVIDPLDGTSNFASSIPWFGVLIALFEKNIPIIGGAYLPVTDQLYLAEKGNGVSMNGKPFTMKKSQGLRLLNESICIYRNLVKEARNIRCTNCLVDFLYVAEGKFGGVINLFTRVWDISALGLIITEAGGMMKYTNGQNIEFVFDANTSTTNYPVMAGQEEILEELRKKVL
jgi:myo-inositol-1(or 4)-monophosphatase